MVISQGNTGKQQVGNACWRLDSQGYTSRWIADNNSGPEFCVELVQKPFKSLVCTHRAAKSSVI